MSALDTWTIDAAAVRRIRSIFRDTPAPAEPLRQPAPTPEPDLQPDESGAPVPVHIWKQFHAVLARILTPHQQVLDALIRAIKDDPILSKELHA